MTTARPRFGAPTASPSPAPAASAPVATGTLPSTGPMVSAAELAQQQAALQAQAQALMQNRMRYQARFEQGQEALRAIEAEAQALGVRTLEELQDLIAESEAQDATELARYTEELAAEKALQEDIEAKLRAMESAA